MAGNNPTIRVIGKDEATASLNKIRDSVSDLTGSVKGFAATLGAGLSVGALVAAFKGIVGSLHDLRDSSQAIGTTAVALAEFRLSAAESGVNAEKLDTALTRLNVHMIDAAGGGKQSAAAFNALGIELRSGSGQLKNTDEILGEIANKFQGYRDGAEKSALAVALFGRAGAAMIPFLNQGADGLRRFAGVTDETVAAAERLQRQFDTLKANSQILGISLAKDLIPFISKTIEEFNAAKAAADGFGGALLLLAKQSPDTLADPGKKVNELRTQLERLKEENSKPFTVTDFIKFGSEESRTKFNERGVAALEKELKFLKELERNRALVNFAADYSNEGHAAMRAAPIIKKDTDLRKEKNEVISESRRALAQYIEQLDHEANKLAELSEKERVLQFLQQHPEVDTAQTRELLFQQAQLVEDARQEKAIKEESARVTKTQLDYTKSLRDEVLQLAGVAEEQRKIALTEQLELLIKQSQEIEAMGGKPILTKEQIEQAVKGIAGIKDEVKETNRAAEEFGLLIASAIGEFVKNPNVKTFFSSVAQDVLSLTTKLLIMEPIARSIRQLLEGSGGGFDIGSIFGSLVGALGGSSSGGSTATGTATGFGGFAGYATGTDYVPRTELALVHKGEKIIPAHENAWGTSNRAGSVINISVQGSVTNENAGRLGATIGRTIAANSRRYN